jgi:hypothetical protein
VSRPLLRVLSHQRVLSSYAGELLKRLPKTMTGGTAAQPPYSGTDWHVRLPDEEESVLCSILATAEYCRYEGVVGWGTAINGGLGWAFAPQSVKACSLEPLALQEDPMTGHATIPQHLGACLCLSIDISPCIAVAAAAAAGRPLRALGA